MNLGIRGAQAAAAHLAGDMKALPSYAERLNAIRKAYEGNRLQAYQQEGRVSSRPFWRRRFQDVPTKPDEVRSQSDQTYP